MLLGNKFVIKIRLYVLQEWQEEVMHPVTRKGTQSYTNRIEQDLTDLLNHFGDLLSDIVEELFDDGGRADSIADGTNRTGIYVARVRLHLYEPMELLWQNSS